jgi:hypothetical protein
MKKKKKPMQNITMELNPCAYIVVLVVFTGCGSGEIGRNIYAPEA